MTLATSPDVVFKFLLLAAYDKRPYVEGVGYEGIWGIGTSDSISTRLKELKIDFTTVRGRPLDDLDSLMATSEFNGHSLRFDGYVNYAECVQEIAGQAENLTHQLGECSNSYDVKRVFDSIRSIHGFGGGTIASKIVKYWFREIGVGSVSTADFPEEIVTPILGEVHNKTAATVHIAANPNFVEEITSELLKKEDPFAVDALFYLHRRKNEVKWLSRHGADTKTFEAIMPIIESVAADNGSWDTGMMEQMKVNHRTQGVRAMRLYYERCIEKASAHNVAKEQSAKGKRTLESEYPKFHCALQFALRPLRFLISLHEVQVESVRKVSLLISCRLPSIP